MKKINKYLLPLCLLCIVFFFNACKTIQTTVPGGLKTMPKEERVKNIIHQFIPYETFSASVNFNLKPGAKKKSNSVDGQLRIIKNECIQISLRMPLIGSELMKIQITPEMIHVIDRYNKQYLSESLTDIKQIYPIDFDYYDLEALFTNRLFITGNTDMDIIEYDKFEISEDLYFASLRYTDSQEIAYTFKTDNTGYVVETAIGKEGSETQLTWVYSDFKWIYSDVKPVPEHHLFPAKESITISTSDDVFRLDLTFKKIELNNNVNIDYNIPTKYTRIDFNQFIKIINGL